MSALVVIPARYASTRFPGKMLARLAGRTVIEWVWSAAMAAKVGPVVVATDDKRIAHTVKGFGGTAVMTPIGCASGSDRAFAATRSSGAAYIIDVQGDMPLIKPSTIRAVAALLSSQKKADITTAVIPMTERTRISDSNVVKAALGRTGRALYFSRSPIPFPRGPKTARFEHLGIYGFRRAALSRFVKLPPSTLERAESLEQLRALEDGMSIYAAVVVDRPVAIDVPQDLRRAERLLKSMTRRGQK